MSEPRVGDRTRVVRSGPGGRPVAAHWCQPLPYSRPGSTSARCGYCGAPLARVDDASPWHYGEARAQLSMDLVG